MANPSGRSQGALSCLQPNLSVHAVGRTAATLMTMLVRVYVAVALLIADSGRDRVDGH